jgi:hypothetical protein
MRVLVECYPDEAVLRALGVPKRQVRHAAGKGEVLNRLRDLREAIGMVDEDPASAQPRELGNYEQVADTEGLRLMARRGSSGQRLIILCPRLEDWLMQRARACGVDPTQHCLPSRPRELHDIPRYDRKDGFRPFLAALNGRDSGMGRLRRWIIQGDIP